MQIVDRGPGTNRFSAFLIGVLCLIGAAFVAFSLYERIVLGEPSLGIGKLPIYTPYYLGRMLLAFGLSLLLIVGLFLLRDGQTSIDRPGLSAAQQASAYAMMSVAASGIVLFIDDPVLFYELALEDRALEWASAFLPLASSGLFVFAAWRILFSQRRDARRGADLAFSALFAVGLFVVGMEEISWMQRVFDIQTPVAFAGNQQQEMNLHNMHSIAIGTAHKLAMYAGLIVLPFLVEVSPKIRLLDSISDFLPTRLILVISAPFAAYNFNAWNFFLTPVIVFLTAVILACHGWAAWRRNDRQETMLFLALAVFVAVGQAAFLTFGANSVRLWDYSEYAELFMAIALAVFSGQTFIRLLARYPTKASRASPPMIEGRGAVDPLSDHAVQAKAR